MSTRYSPERRTIGNLLNVTNPPIVVPNWQRNYSWTSSHVDAFWKDLVRFEHQYPREAINDQEYFLGSIVIVRVGQSHLLLDGQQRVATSAILLSVIRDFLERYSHDAAQRVSNRYLTDYDDAAHRTTFKLTLNKYDRDFFKREVLESRHEDYLAPTISIESHGNIRQARQYFVDRFTERYGAHTSPEESYLWALRVLEVITNHVSVVAVMSDDEDNAANVFEILNDRGIGLSTADLLRNLIIRRAPPENEDEIIDLWGQILEIEGDAKLRVFLRHFWISYQGDVKTQSLYREIKNSVEAENTSSLEFSRKLRDSSIIYSDITLGRDDDREIAGLLDDINDVGGVVLYPAILSAYEVGSSEQVKLFLRALLVAFVRHHVIGRLEGSHLEDVVYELAKEIRSDRDFAAAIGSLKELAPSNESFINSFQVVSVADHGTARYILREIELHRRTTEELDVAHPPRIHLEHIYPQTPRPGSRWENHSSMLNRLGNLTLLSGRLNSTIRNAPFSDKKAYYERSELLITRSLTIKVAWDSAAIVERQRELSTHVASIWAFPH